MLDFLFRSTPLLFLTRPLWRDEAFTVILARLPILELLKSTAGDSNPPLYYLILKVWMQIFGSSEIAVRSFSVICFAFLIYGIYLLLTHLYRESLIRNVPWLLLTITNPLLVYYAFEARMYMLVAALALYSWYTLLKKKYVLYVIICVLGILTHYFFAFLLVGQFLYGLRQKKKQFFIAFGISMACCLPWFIFLMTHIGASHGGFWIPRVTIIDIIHLPAIVYFGFERIFSYPDFIVEKMSGLISISSLIGWILLILIGMKHRKTHYRPILLIAFCWVVIPTLITLGISIFVPLLLPRYIIFISVGIICLLPLVFHQIPKSISFLFFIFLLFLNLQYLSYQDMYRVKGDTAFYQATKEINAMIRPHDAVYVTSDLDYFTARYYFLDHPVFIYNHNYADIPWFVGKALINRNAIRNSVTQYPSYTFLLDSNGAYKIVTQQ